MGCSHGMPNSKRPLLLEASSENLIHSTASMYDLGGDGRTGALLPPGFLLPTCLLHQLLGYISP